MRKEIDGVYTVFTAVVMGWRYATCDHFVARSLNEVLFSFHL